MKQNPCPCCKNRNVIPTSKRGLCSRCEEVVSVIDYLVGLEKAEAEKVAKRKSAGLVLPDEVRSARHR